MPRHDAQDLARPTAPHSGITSESTESPARSTLESRQSGAVLVFVMLVFLGHLPLLLAHARGLWNRPHYQFFPLALLGAAVLAYRRLPPAAELVPGTAGGCRLLGALAWGLLAIASLIGSRWLGAVAALTTLATAIYWMGGWALFLRLLPVWCYLWLLVPPPFDADQELISGLQTWTSKATGRVLDFLEVPHLRGGNTLTLPGRSLFVEEACSGIQSFYAVLAFTGAWLLLGGSSLARGLFLLLAAVVWVLAANLVRVVAVAYCLGRWHLNLTSGWRHDALGALLFVLTIGLIASTDQLWLALASAQPGTRSAERKPQLRTPRSAIRAPWWVGPAFGCLALVQLAWFVPIILEAHTSHRVMQPALDALTADSLSSEWNGWKQTAFEVSTRSSRPFFSDHSRQWIYQSGRMRVAVAVDYPFTGWHALPVCYTSAGWSVQSSEEQPGETQFVQLAKASGRRGFLWYALFDGRGQRLSAPEKVSESAPGLWQEWRRRLALLPLDRRREQSTYQVQLLIEHAGVLTNAELQQAAGLFERACEVVAQPFAELQP